MPQVVNFIEQCLMGWGNRGWVEIIEGILEICQNDSLKTHIMYRCNLNSKQISYYIQFLQDHRLLESTESSSSKRSIFHITESGRKYIMAYRQLESIFK